MTGWTHRRIQNLTIREASTYIVYWNKHPPVHEMVAAYLGIGQKRGIEVKDKDTLNLFLGQLGGAGIKVQRNSKKKAG